MSKITNKGTKWELLNSLWILLSCFLLGWIGLLYAGITTKTRKWIICGVIYCIILNVTLALSKTINQDVLGGIFLAYWIGTFVHSLIIRKEYLMRREALLDSRDEQIKDWKDRQKIREEYHALDVTYPNTQKPTSKETEATKQIRLAEEKKKINPESNPGIKKEHTIERLHQTQPEHVETVQPQETEINKNTKHPVVDSNVLDINNCDEGELEKLPGVSLVMAKKAIAYRESKGGFDSVDDFYESITLRPHFISQINDKIECGKYQKKNETVYNNSDNDTKNDNQGKSGRILDI